jgi:hypothetical protein
MKLGPEECTVDAEAQPVKTLNPQQVDAIADLVVAEMPDGVRGFCKSWGYRQFANELFRVLHGWRPAPADGVKFTILGEPASKANSRQIVTLGGHASSIKSAKARSFEAVALLQIPPAAKRMYATDVCVTVRIFYASRRPDLDESVVLDVMQAKFTGTGKKRKLVRAGVYINDRLVREKHIYWGLDPKNPRVEIAVRPMGQGDLINPESWT